MNPYMVIIDYNSLQIDIVSVSDDIVDSEQYDTFLERNGYNVKDCACVVSDQPIRSNSNIKINNVLTIK